MKPKAVFFGGGGCFFLMNKINKILKPIARLARSGKKIKGRYK